MKSNTLPLPKGASVSSPMKQFASSCSISCLIALVISAALISLCAVILTKAAVPHSVLEPLTTILSALATLISVYIGSLSSTRNQTLSVGISSGAMVFAVVFLLSLLFGDGDVTGQTIIKLIAYLSAGGIGSLAGSSKKRKAKLKI